MIASFYHRVMAEYEAMQGLGRMLDEEIAREILEKPVVRDPATVEDQQLLKYRAWTPKGIEAYEATRQYLYTLFGGAKGGGKTVTGARIIASDVSEYRGGLYVVMRKNYTTLHTTTKKSFGRFFPPELIVRKTTNTWYLVNDNELLWWSADRSRDPDYEKTRGLEATGIFADESSEFDDQLYQLLPSLLRREALHVESGAKHPGWIYLTSNPVPGTNFLKRRFIDERTRMRDGRHVFIPSLPDDNPLLPANYTDIAFSTMDDAILRMLRYGDWNVEASEFVIVPLQHFMALTTDRVTDREPVAAGIDIGLGRPDRTIVYCANSAGEMWMEAAYELYDTTDQITALTPVCEQVKGNGGQVWIDEGSVGKGVVDALARAIGPTIVGVMFGASADEERQPDGTMRQVHHLKRDQLYFWLREDAAVSAELLTMGEPPLLRLERSESLQEELENTYYLPTDRYMKLEPKDEIRRRIGRSPDEADAAVLCNAARRRRMRSAPTIPTTRTTRRRSSLTEGY